METVGVVGVPKHSELEPHHFVAERNGKSASKCRLIASKPLKSVFLCAIISPVVDWNSSEVPSQK